MSFWLRDRQEARGTKCGIRGTKYEVKIFYSDYRYNTIPNLMPSDFATEYEHDPGVSLFEKVDNPRTSNLIHPGALMPKRLNTVNPMPDAGTLFIVKTGSV